MGKKVAGGTEITKAAAEVASTGRVAKAKLKARGEELVAKAQALTGRIARDFWELGRLLMTMRDEGVYGAMGFERFDAMVAARLGIAPTLTWKLVAVAGALPKADAVKLGQEKAYALIVYARAAHPDDDAATLARSDAKIAGKPVSEASLREIQAAAAAARPKRPPTLAELAQEKEDKALVGALQAHLGPVGIPKASVSVQGDSVLISMSRRQAERLLRAR